MPKCKNDPERTYKGTEPSPKGLGYCAHSEKVGQKRKGKDEYQWIVKQVKNSKRWMKLKTESTKSIIKENDNDILNKLLKKKHITNNDEELIKNMFCNDEQCKKEYFNKFIKHIYSLKQNKYKIQINKYLELYDEYLIGDGHKKVKTKLDKGDYNVYTANYIKNTTSMIIIEKNEKFKLDDVTLVKSKHCIEIDDSQNIIFEENNNKLYQFELEGRQFFGYNPTIYYGKINDEIKLIIIPIIDFLNENILSLDNNRKNIKKETIKLKLDKKLIKIPSYNKFNKYKLTKYLDSLNLNDYNSHVDYLKNYLKLKKNYTKEDIINKLGLITVDKKIVKKITDYNKIPKSIIDYYKTRLENVRDEDIINSLLEYLHIQYNEKSIFDFDIGLIVIENKYGALNEEGPRDYVFANLKKSKKSFFGF